MKSDGASEQCPRHDIEPDPLHPVGYRQMLRAGRPDDCGSGDSQLIDAEGIGVVGSDRLGRTSDDRRIDRGVPDDMSGKRGRRRCLSQSEVPSATSWIPALPWAE